ncbi:MAG: hypothetical protein RIC55_19195 [Pirellulaceae bacterium]
MVTFADFQHRNPMRPADWRWRRAEHLVTASKKHCRHRDDEVTGEAVEYLRRRRRCKSREQVDNLAHRMPDIATARRLHVEGGLLMAMVQARILARQPTAEIAQHMALADAGIATYEQLFFDVRDRLDARCYVLLAAVRGSSDEDVATGRVYQAIRLLGYFGGPLVIDRVHTTLMGVPAASPQHGASGVSDVQHGTTRMLIDMLSLPEDENSMHLFRAFHDLEKSTHVDGAVADAPFVAAVEQLVAVIDPKMRPVAVQEPVTVVTETSDDEPRNESREVA